MKIYLAAPWIDKDKMAEVSKPFEDAGHKITWHWWQVPGAPEDGTRNAYLTQEAENDADGVFRADVLVLLNTARSEGKAVEQGLAIAWSKPIIAVGKRGEHSLNVFHYLPEYKWVPTVQDAIDILNIGDYLRVCRSKATL